jgi:hypothetical protein
MISVLSNCEKAFFGFSVRWYRPVVHAAARGVNVRNSETAALGNRTAEIAVLVLAGAMLLAPVWLVRYPPLVDYPNHLARYFILAHLKDPNLHLAHSYGSHWGPYPYVAVDLLALGLQWLMPIHVAGKVILSLCILGMPLAALFFLRKISPEGKYLAAWALVIAYGPLFMSGLINDILSEAICFLFLGLWLNYLRRPHAILWCGLLALATLLYFTHLVGFAIAALVVFTYSLLTRQTLPRLVTSLSLFATGGIVHLLQLVTRAGDYWGRNSPHFSGLRDKLLTLTTDLFRAYARWDVLIILLALCICLLISVWKNPEFGFRYPWAGVAGVVLLVFLLMPEVGYHFFDIRILPYLFILSLCAIKVGRRARLVGAIGLLVFVLRSVDVVHGFMSQQAQLQRLARSFTAIPAYSRVLPMEPMSANEAFFRRPYMHFWAYGVIERGWFCPNLFHGQGLHPLVLHKSKDELLTLNDLSRLNWPTTGHLEPGWQNVQLDPDWQEIPRHFDYLWIYDMPRFTAPGSSVGKLVYSDGLIAVFQLRGPAAP